MYVGPRYPADSGPVCSRQGESLGRRGSMSIYLQRNDSNKVGARQRDKSHAKKKNLRQKEWVGRSRADGMYARCWTCT